ncbi:MAG: signal peptidase II [Deltaproteobacteria bacterium]|nr:signal peptidase II [Deltaproteobacteria bacterium]
MKFAYRPLCIVTPLVFLLDQWTKWMVVRHIPLGHGLAILPGYIDLVHVRNRGAAFGLFAGGDSPWRAPFFYLVSIVAVGVILWIVRHLRETERLMAVTMALILGGIFGNLLDRLRLGAVTDFLSCHFRDVVIDGTLLGFRIRFPLDWPAFNVADSAITISMLLLAYHIVRSPHQ